MSSPGNLERAPRVEIVSDLRASAGAAATATLVLTNTASAPRVLSVTALGVDASWLPRPSRSRTLAPGESIQVELTFRPAVGTIPAQYPLAVAVQALDPVNSQATAPTAIAELVLTVDAPGTIALRLAPPDTTGVFGKKVELLVENTGAQPASVELYPEAAAGLRLALDRYRVEVPAGQTVPVPGRVSTGARLTGARVRRAYAIEGRSGSAPRRVEGSYTSRALLGSGTVRGVALLALVAIWVAAAIVFIPKLADHVKRDRTTTVAGGTTTASASPTAGSANTGGGSGGSGSGSGGSGGGNSGGGAGSGGKSGGGSGSGPGSAATVQLNGNVVGADASGVLVTMAASSPVDAAQSAETGTDSAGAAVLLHGFSAAKQTGKVSSEAVFTLAPAATAQNRTTHTTSDGAWTLPAVPMPGYYELTFSKPGYQTVRYLVDSSSAAASQPLNVSLVAAHGVLTGTVRGPGGVVGGATVTITDGINTLSTSSNSKGKVGSWSVSGLSTPSTYLVTATKDGLSTESTLVTLGAGGSEPVSLTLKRGVASLLGRVEGADNSGAHAGLGGASVTVSLGDVTRTVTTVTRGGVAGRYILPDLPSGTYTVTVAASGYQPQTSKLRIKSGQSSATLDVTLLSSSGSVIGQVTGSSSMSGAGLTLSNPENTYKTTAISEPDGQFSFDGLAPGSYTLTASQFRYQTATVQVTVVAGQTTDLLKAPIVLSEVGVSGLPTTSQIDGQVTDASGNPLTDPSGNPLTCLGSDGHATDQCITATTTDPAFVTDSNPHGSVSSVIAPSGTYHLGTKGGAGLTPGLHTVTLTAPGYEPGQVKVSVPSGALVVAPVGKLLPAPRLFGTIKASLGTPSGQTCVWAVLSGHTVPSACSASGHCLLGIDATAVACTSVMDPASTLEHPIVAANGTGSYELQVPVEGTYTVYVKSGDPRYNTLPDAGGVAVRPESYYLRAGQPNEFDATMHRLGQLNVQVWVPGSGANQVAAGAGVSIFTSTASCSATVPAPDPDEAAGTTSSLGAATIDGVNSALAVWASSGGDYDCVAAPVPPVDGSTDVNLHLTEVVPAMVGRLVYRVDGQTLPVTGMVKAAAITSYSGGTGLTSTYTLTTDPYGCFGIKSTAAITVPSTDPKCPAIAASTNASQVWTVASPQKIRSANLTLTVNAGTGYLPVTNQAVTMNADPSITDISLTAGQVGFTTEPAVTATTVPTWSAVTASVQVCTGLDGGGNCTSWAAAPSSITAAAPSGSLVWHDTAYGASSTDQYQPGHYRVTVAAPGYEGSTAVIDCPVGGTCAIASGVLRLVHLGQITGSVTDVTSGSTQPVNGAKVTAVLCDGSASGPDADGYYSCTASSTSYAALTDTGSNGKYTITGSGSAVPGLHDAGDWLLVVDAPGYCTGTPDVSSGSCAHAPDSSVSTGDTVYGAGAASLTGDVSSGTDLSSADVPLSVTEQQTAVTVTLQHDVSGGSPLPVPDQALTLTGGDLDPASPRTGTTDGNGHYDFGLLDPGTYTVGYAGDQVVTGSGDIKIDFCTPTADGYASATRTCAVTKPVTATAATNSVTVTLTANQGSSPPGVTTAFSGATVCVVADDAGTASETVLAGTTCADDAIKDVNNHTLTPTSSGGTYLFSNVGSTPKDKNYYVRAEAPDGYGYQPWVSVPFVVKFSGPSAVSQSGTLQRVTRNVTVTVSFPDADTELAATTAWTLTSGGATPAGSAPVNGTQTASAVTGVSDTGGVMTKALTFTQVPYGCWIPALSSSLTDHHGIRFSRDPDTAADTDGVLTCTSKDSFVVSGKTDTTSPVSATYAPLDEYSASVSVSLSAAATAAESAGLPDPGKVTLKATDTNADSGLQWTVDIPSTSASLGWFMRTKPDGTTPNAISVGGSSSSLPSSYSYSSSWTIPDDTITPSDAAGSIELDFDMEKVTVTVTDSASTPDPLTGTDNGASVTLNTDGADTPPTWWNNPYSGGVDTDGSGKVALWLPPDVTGWTVTASADGYARHTSAGFSSDEGSFSVKLVPTRTVTFTVDKDDVGTGTSSTPFDGADVEVTGDLPDGVPSWYSPPGEVHTGVDGTVSLALPYGTDWNVKVSASGYATRTLDFDVSGTSTDPGAVTLVKTGSVTIKVTDHDNGDAALQSTSVTLTSPYPWFSDESDTTDSNGEVTFSNVPYSASWKATVTGLTNYHSGDTGTFTIDGTHPAADVPISLSHETATFNVTVTTSSGDPISGATLTIDAPYTWYTAPTGMSTNGSGTYSLTLPYGTGWKVTAAQSGYTSSATFNVSGSAPTTAQATIKLSNSP